jgi:hypothetical protein
MIRKCRHFSTISEKRGQSMNNRFLLYAFAATLLVTLPFTACKSNDNGDDDDDSFSASSITFTPNGSGQTGDIWLELVSSDPKTNSFQLKVVGSGIETAYGVAGRLTFDRKIASLDEATAGNALEGNNAVLVARGTSNDEGGIFGVSRSVDFQNDVEITESKTIATLSFTVLGTGTTEIKFVENLSRVMDKGLDSVEIGNWSGGTLTVE